MFYQNAGQLISCRDVSNNRHFIFTCSFYLQFIEELSKHLGTSPVFYRCALLSNRMYACLLKKVRRKTQFSHPTAASEKLERSKNPL